VKEPCTAKLTSIILKSKHCIFFLLCLNCFFIIAGNKNKIDSLLAVVNDRQSSDTAKSFCYMELSELLQLQNPNKSLQYINKSISIFKSYSNEFQYRRFLRKAQILKTIGQVDSSIYYINSILDMALKNNNYHFISFGYGEFGNLCITQNNFQKAIEYFNKQIAIIKKNKLPTPVSEIYNNIGIAYGNKGDWDMASEYFKRATKDDILNNRFYALGNDYNNIGVVYIVKHKIDSAKKYMLMGLECRLKENDVIGISGSINNLALLEKEVGNYKKALFFADSAFRIAERNDLKKLQVEIFDTYDQVYSQMGDYKKAYEYLNKKNRLNATFQREESNNKIQQLESHIELEQKQSQLLEKDLELTKSEKQKQKQFGVIIIGTVLVIALLIFLFTFLKNNKILKQRNSLISEQKHLIEEKHKDITDSINYAQRIQSALIISEENLNKNLKETFVIFKPRDVVSGDFYWYSELKGYKIIALADCTGHGVPGAFMSMIGITLLNQVVNEKGITSPAGILNNLRKGVIDALNTDASDKRDGMDMAIIAFNEKELLYAGANSQALLLDNGKIVELKPNKQPIGYYEKQDDFTEQRLAITENLKIYLFSDGIVDQFGGENGKKVKTRQLKEWLLLTSTLNLNAQKKVIAGNIDKWKTGFEQTDDMCLIGVKLS